MDNKTADFGYKQVDAQSKQKLVQGVFDSVAPNYDIMNDMMSLGIHRVWKRFAISHCQLRESHVVLDLAAGTGDLSLLMAPKIKSGHVVLCDLNHNMLDIAKSRLIDKGLINQTSVVQANAQNLPFPKNYFDRIIIGFGLRNVTDKSKALESMYTVLKPGGKMIILEFSHPENPVISKAYDLYSFNVLPWLGKWIAKDASSYQYLAESIRMHPNQEKLKQLILDAGFDECHYSNLSGGIVALHKGVKC